MKFKPTLFVFIFFTTLYSCGDIVKTPISYNDAIIDEQLKVVALLDSMYLDTETPISKIKEFREQLVVTSENAYKTTSELSDFKGNTSFRDAAKNYFGYLKDFYKDNPRLDTLNYMTNSEERMETMNQDDFEFYEKEYKRYLELEENVLTEQLKFSREFNVALEH